MPFPVAVTISTALVIIILDYCNSLYHNIALKDILTFQHVQNCLARVVTRSPRFSQFTLALLLKIWSVTVSSNGRLFHILFTVIVKYVGNIKIFRRKLKKNICLSLSSIAPQRTV